MLLPTHYPYSVNGIENLIQAAHKSIPAAFGIVFKVQNNHIMNWMYAEPVSLKTIATQQAEVSFTSFDDKRSAQILRELTLNLNEGTPFIALMIRYTGNTPSAWEFVDLSFIKALTAPEKQI